MALITKHPQKAPQRPLPTQDLLKAATTSHLLIQQHQDIEYEDVS